MEFWRNPEIKKILVIHIVLIVVASVLMYCVADIRAGVCMAACGVVFSVVDMLITYRRYQRIADMSNQIDKVLHDQGQSLLDKCDEGELAILSTEIDKLIKRLKEQTERLGEDKVFLADSIADISHQIKTPLTSINLVLSFMRERDISYHRRIELVREMMGLTDRIEWLVYALLKLSRLDAGTVEFECECISMKSLIDEAYKLIEIPLDIRGITWTCSISEDVCFIGDKEWMTEAVSNILKNCMEHTERGGEIVVYCTENPIYSEIVIKDTGCGIASEDISHIFERFYRGSNTDGQSVGIGLALSKSIINKHNGTIKVMNRKDTHGSEFDIRFYKSVV